MKWPTRVQEIVQILAFGVSHSADDETRRATTRKIAEQCRFELGPNWGHKRADAGRPPSADVFCTREPFVGWDWSVPEGIANFPDSIDLAGQDFIEVEPVNHLGATPSEPPQEPTDLTAVWVAINELKKNQVDFLVRYEKDLQEINKSLETLIMRVAELMVEVSRPMKAEGRTGNTAFHTHSVSLDVVRK
jgi:hypothetical protein